MNRTEFALHGIQLPVLPTIILGGLPGPPSWAADLARLGVDVACSGAMPDTDATLAAAASAVPYRPVCAAGPGAVLEGRGWIVHGGAAPAGAVAVDSADVVVAVDGPDVDDPNVIAERVLAVVREDPSTWWVAATGLEACSRAEAITGITALVESVRFVRLFLAKQQFE